MRSHRVTTPRKSYRKMVRYEWVDGKPLLWWVCPECHIVSETYQILYVCMRAVEAHIENPCHK